MASFNKVFLVGNVGKEPEIKTFDNGKIANITLETTKKYRDRSGNQKEETEWHTLVAYAKLADIVERYVHKGSLLHIEGELKTRSWTDKDSGKTNYKTEVVIREMQMLNRVGTPVQAKADDDDEDLPDFLR